LEQVQQEIEQHYRQDYYNKDLVKQLQGEIKHLEINKV
jgi:hypothetical protein